MKLYNTLHRQVQDIKPLKNDEFRMYTCGPTVYDHAHIGNLSAYIFADTLRRTLAIQNDVVHVMNYTDIDDKTIRRSRERYPDMDPHIALHKLTSEYIDLFLDDMHKVGNDTQPVVFLRATDSMDGMKELITALHRSGFAYIADDGVYFSIEAYQKAGKKYGQLLEITAENTSDERIDNDEYDKESIHDFALWKKQKDDEPAWDFTLDGQDLTGRPGWHIECSVMSRKGLGQPFDIHTGGVDLIFPHHENEIAQSTALESDGTMAQVFVHNDHLLVDGKKMAKSAKNFYTLEDIIQKGYDPLAFRLKVLQSHYRSQVNFTRESLDAAQNLLKKLYAWADLKYQPTADHKTGVGESYERALTDIRNALQNDLETSVAISHVAALANDAEEQGIDQGKIQPALDALDKLFGLGLAERPDITDAQKQLITEREKVRQAKDWEKSDTLRDQLTQQDIGVRDTSFGPIWYRL